MYIVSTKCGLDTVWIAGVLPQEEVSYIYK
jgi:hypothetical protein